ncbi:MAG: hypothetical protein WD602_00990 [Actinomycetota bacterium]
MAYQSIISYRCEECDRTIGDSAPPVCAKCERVLCRRHFPLGARLKMSGDLTCKSCAKQR